MNSTYSSKKKVKKKYVKTGLRWLKIINQNTWDFPLLFCLTFSLHILKKICQHTEYPSQVVVNSASGNKKKISSDGKQTFKVNEAMHGSG